MIAGMSVSMFTFVHVALSLIGIFAGLVVVRSMFGSRRSDRWTAVFLATTILTSVTGYFFPREHVLPSHIVGAISLVLLAVAVLALYGRRLAGHWRWIYIASAVAALYLNVFVAVIQAFQKFPLLASLAPTQSEPPFIIAQSIVLLSFVGLAIFATRLYRPALGTAAARAA